MKKTDRSQSKDRAPAPPQEASPSTDMPLRHDAPPRDEGPRWTFLTNHAHVLILLAEDGTQTLRQVAAAIGITERAVQRIIVELEEDGFVQRERVGRQNRYEISYGQPLRHEIEKHRTIGDLLKLIIGDSLSL
jgi:DNA-binding MarR family transcriptional regulator